MSLNPFSGAYDEGSIGGSSTDSGQPSDWKISRSLVCLLSCLKRRTSDTAIYTTRRFANGVQYSAVGFAWPEGAQGWLVDKGHRMVTGGTVARISGRQMGKAPGARSVGLTGAGRVVGFVKPHPIALPAFEQALGPM